MWVAYVLGYIVMIFVTLGVALVVLRLFGEDVDEDEMIPVCLCSIAWPIGIPLGVLALLGVGLFTVGTWMNDKIGDLSERWK